MANCDSRTFKVISKSRNRAKQETKYKKPVDTSTKPKDDNTLKINSTENLREKCKLYCRNKPFGVYGTLLWDENVCLGYLHERPGKIPQNSWLAVRILDISKTPEIKLHSKFNAIKQFHHKNLASFVSTMYSNNLYIAMELKGRPLSDITNSIKLSESTISLICHDILQAIVYLHDLMIIHRNVRPENIMISSDGSVKLADYRIENCFVSESSDDLMISNLDVDTYVAPEILEGKSYGRKVDVWSLGALTVYMKRFDFNNCGKKVEISPRMRAFVDRCLKKNPEKRFCSKQLAKSSFVTNHETYKKFAALMKVIDDSYGFYTSCSLPRTTKESKPNTPSKILPTLRVEMDNYYKYMHEEEDDYFSVTEYDM